MKKIFCQILLALTIFSFTVAIGLPFRKHTPQEQKPVTIETDTTDTNFYQFIKL